MGHLDSNVMLDILEQAALVEQRQDRYTQHLRQWFSTPTVSLSIFVYALGLIHAPEQRQD
jgi:hypothetical protein